MKTGFPEKSITLPEKAILPGVSVSVRKEKKYILFWSGEWDLGGRAVSTTNDRVLAVQAETIETEALCWACGAAGAKDGNERNARRGRALPVAPRAGTGRRRPAAMEVPDSGIEG